MDKKKTQNIFFGCLITIAVFVIIIVILLSVKVTPLEEYHDPDYGFSLKYPAYWAKIMRPEDGAGLVSFFPRPIAEDDKFIENISITMSEIPPGSDLTNIKNFSQNNIKVTLALFKESVNVLEQKEIRVGGLPAYRFLFITNESIALTGHKMKYLFIWVLRGNQAFTMTFFGDQPQFNDHVKDVNRMIRTFRFDK